MATKQLPNFSLENPVEDGIITTEQAEDISNIVDDIDAQLSSITSEFGTDKLDVKFTVKVYRVVENRGELAWLFDCTPAELPILTKLRDDYKGGRFECRVYKNNRIFKRIKVVVEAPLVTSIPVAQKNEMAEILKAVSEQQNQQFAMLRETLIQMTGKPVAPQPSMLDMMDAMMGIMVQMKQFTAPVNPAPAVDTEKMMDLFLRGMEMGRDSGGNEPEGMMGILKELIKSPLLGAAAQAMTQAPALPHNPQPVKPAQISAPKESPAVTVPENPVVSIPQGENMPVNPMVKYYVDMLVKKAEADSDPALYAAFIVDNIPMNLIEQHLMQENLLQQLSQVNPNVMRFQNWFMELRNEIHAILTEPEDDGDTGQHDTGTTDNASNDTVRGGGDPSNS